jgi:site-specific recombinase XerD
MRHTFASLLLRNGCDLMSIKEMLGHASLESTAIYLHIEMSSLKVAIDRHPLAAMHSG